MDVIKIMSRDTFFDKTNLDLTVKLDRLSVLKSSVLFINFFSIN